MASNDDARRFHRLDFSDTFIPAMESQPPPLPEQRFLDPLELIERSHPLPRTGWLWYLAGGFMVVVLMSTYAGSRSPELQAMVRVLAGISMLGLTLLMSLITWFAVSRQREEALEAMEELVQLRRWPEAAMMLQAMLSAPVRSPQARLQALIYLTGVLARYHRYSDAMVVQEHLLEEGYLDPGAAYAMRLGRAMAMLHEDQLVDADRAIGELRRVEGSDQSAGLALVELYRDVKTGHPAEAIEIFTKRQEVLRKQLGHRVADAWALAAKAYDMVGHEDSARVAYANATLLAPIAEISRKYAEVASLTGKYTPAAAPSE
jgi:tetratricopeptide (TPR) repeat protein